MRILLDLDEVLADFVGGAARAWEVSPTDLIRHWPAGEWDITPPLSKALGRRRTMNPEEFWGRLNGSPSFWAQLDPLPWMTDVLYLISSTTQDWLVVTAPSLCPHSYVGKVQWLQRYLGAGFTRFVITPHKYLLACPGSVLIDDRDTSVESFTKHGGRGIVFPRHHNSAHVHKTDPLAYLRDQLATL